MAAMHGSNVEGGVAIVSCRPHVHAAVDLLVCSCTVSSQAAATASINSLSCDHGRDGLPPREHAKPRARLRKGSREQPPRQQDPSLTSALHVAMHPVAAAQCKGELQQPSCKCVSASGACIKARRAGRSPEAAAWNTCPCLALSVSSGSTTPAPAGFGKVARACSPLDESSQGRMK